MRKEAALKEPQSARAAAGGGGPLTSLAPRPPAQTPSPSTDAVTLEGSKPSLALPPIRPHSSLSRQASPSPESNEDPGSAADSQSAADQDTLPAI